jgi:hypothetical protein
MNNHQTGADASHVKKAKKIAKFIEGASLYKKSIHENEGDLFFVVRKGLDKKLIVAFKNGKTEFKGTSIALGEYNGLICDLSYENTEAIRARFPFTKPVPLGNVNSYGFGDRLGNAGPAHLRAVRNTEFKPVLAQQSIRELERTNRTAHEVMDAATWSVFQEGYHDGFGADGDHLKTEDDIDRMVEAGYTMFTIDPSEFVQDDVSNLRGKELQTAYEKLPWDQLEVTPDSLLERYISDSINLGNGNSLDPTREEVLKGMIKYGKVVTHTRKMADHLKKKWPDHPAELELSVDETKDPTTLFEHYLVASELNRLGVELVSLAPRFCGDFEKGIDFKGDLDQFREEYIQHLSIADKFGGYKLSIHSGSDKFSVYKVIGSIDNGTVHVKTAGTSYLEALRTIAEAEPELFREILNFSIKRFQEDKKTYHISADPKRIPDPSSLNVHKLKSLLDDDDARQVLHVAYGSVLSGVLPEAKGFKKRLMDTLEMNEELHEENLVRHFERHLQPFE